MLRPSFYKLKSNYKKDKRKIHTCSMHFPNTCAIRMSEALVRSNEKILDVLKKSIKNKCPHGYIRGAQALGAILAKPSVFGARNFGWNAQENSSNPPDDVIGKKGIVCYMNIPGFSGQGHIDLWSGTEPVGDEYWDAEIIWMWILK
ncbi:MAG: hypothetical protein COB33_005055 [Thiotrichaceae bacterium]|nr:hypothetical protein [Thiotrichaceae bacterium]